MLNLNDIKLKKFFIQYFFMKPDSLNSRMLVNGIMFVVGLTSIITGINNECGNGKGFQGGRNLDFERPRYGRILNHPKLYSENQLDSRENNRIRNQLNKTVHSYAGYTFAGLLGVHLLQHYNPIKNYFRRKK